MTSRRFNITTVALALLALAALGAVAFARQAAAQVPGVPTILSASDDDTVAPADRVSDRADLGLTDEHIAAIAEAVQSGSVPVTPIPPPAATPVGASDTWFIPIPGDPALGCFLLNGIAYCFVAPAP